MDKKYRGEHFMDMELLTVAQTAKYLQLSEKTVRRMIGEGTLQASKLSTRTWRIRTCDIDSYYLPLQIPNLNWKFFLM